MDVTLKLQLYVVYLMSLQEVPNIWNDKKRVGL
jgi:hypothetical protein